MTNPIPSSPPADPPPSARLGRGRHQGHGQPQAPLDLQAIPLDLDSAVAETELVEASPEPTPLFPAPDTVDPDLVDDGQPEDRRGDDEQPNDTRGDEESLEPNTEDGAEDQADDEPVLELRQIAGLTAGVVMDLEARVYDFAEGEGSVGFTVHLDENGRAVVIPGTVEVKLDAITIDEPSPIGSAVLDVGTARFVVRPKRQRKRATDWLDQHASLDEEQPLIEVPPGMVGARTRSRWLRRRPKPPTESESHASVTTWEFVEQVRETRASVADQERYQHPGPAELAVRARHRAPILGMRPPGHPEFAKVGVVVADRPWLPNFDDIRTIPDEVGLQIQPLLSLPSIPITADLTQGPLGIVGRRNAALAVARFTMLSLRGLSTADLRLHLSTSAEQQDAWTWAQPILDPTPVDPSEGFPVVILDGMAHFGQGGYSHQDAIDRLLGLVVVAASVDELPTYCGTVLQVDPDGPALLTNHLGKTVTGTPVGVNTPTAAAMAADLAATMATRGRP